MIPKDHSDIKHYVLMGMFLFMCIQICIYMHDSVLASKLVLSIIYGFSNFSLMSTTWIKPLMLLELIFRDSDSAQLEGACNYLLCTPEMILM